MRLVDKIKNKYNLVAYNEEFYYFRKYIAKRTPKFLLKSLQMTFEVVILFVTATLFGLNITYVSFVQIYCLYLVLQVLPGYIRGMQK